MTKKTVMALAAVAGLAVCGWSADSVDSGAAMKSAVAASGDKAVLVPPAGSKYIDAISATRDCEKFTFLPASPLTSTMADLVSVETIRECQNAPFHQGGPNCYDRQGRRWQMYVKVEMASRELLPWESEQFTVCMQSGETYLVQERTAYNYNFSGIAATDGYGRIYKLVATGKVPTQPDPEGLFAAANYDGKTVTLSVTDKWANYYAGEKTEIYAALVASWGNSNVAEQTIQFDPAQNYKITFSQKLEPKSSYYVRWGFKRLGKVSTNDYVKAGNTPTFVGR